MSRRKSSPSLRMPTGFDRRRFLQALGLGGLGLAGATASRSFLSSARAGGETSPRRILFFITPHGTVWKNWKTTRAGLPTDRFAEFPLASVDDLSPILRPLDRHREKLLVIEGLAKTTFFMDSAQLRGTPDADLNEHHLGQAHLLTCSSSINNRPGETALGGAISIDQHMGPAVRGTSTWATRIYGDQHQHPYSFVARGEPAPRTGDPGTAYGDITGVYVPPMTGEPSRADLIRMARASVVDRAADEFDAVLPRLGRDDRLKLERHRDLLRDLERTFGGGSMPTVCDPSFTPAGHVNDQFSRISTIALACDLTRVVTFQARGLTNEECGGTPGANFHQDYAHTCIEGEASYTPDGERVVTEYNRVYATHFANLLDQLDSVDEGDGTLLDHTLVLWVSELATGTHAHRDLPIVAAGGRDFFRTGRWVRYPETYTTPFSWGGPYNIGPSMNQLYVTAMRGMGMADDGFGEWRTATGVDGSTIPLTGTLPELHV